MLYARQSTAIIVTVGPVLDADGVAVTDGVVGDFKISKNGAAPAALNGSATLTHRHTGHYSLSLTATDVNTVGTAEVVIDDTVNACPMKEIQVVEPATYDVLFADAAPGPASPTNITAAAGCAVSSLGANVITAAATAADFTTEIQSGLATAAALDAVDNFLDTEIAAILAAVDTEIAAIKAVTDLLPDAGALSSLATQASVNTIDDFLDTEIAAILAAVDTEVGAIKTKTDGLTFTIAGVVDANVQRVNDVTIVGDGSATPFNV